MKFCRTLPAKRAVYVGSGYVQFCDVRTPCLVWKDDLPHAMEFLGYVVQRLYDFGACASFMLAIFSWMLVRLELAQHLT